MSTNRFFCCALLASVLGCGVSDVPQPRNEAAPSGVPESPSVEPSVASPSNPPTRPQPPFEVPEPNRPDKMFADIDWSESTPSFCQLAARGFAERKNYPAAAHAQYWFVENNGGEDGLYDLACYLSRTGEVEASFHWLFKAAEIEGVDANWAREDLDLANLRRDRRWPAANTFLGQCDRYWEHSGVREHVLVVPSGYSPQRPVPLVIGLHGLGARAQGFVSDAFQEWADELQVAFLSVSGTIPRGPKSFVWSEEPERDARRIEETLDELRDRLLVAPGKIMLFGFSQGAMVSVEVAARNPERFAGALAMSPGGRRKPNTANLTSQSAHRLQGYVTVCGAEEHPGNVAITVRYDKDMRRLQARAQHKLYPDVSKHTFPPDFDQQFPNWIRFVLSLATNGEPEKREQPAPDSNP